MSALEELLARVQSLPAKEREQLGRDAFAATSDVRWVPNVGPQTAAYYSEADELLYGGEAGGGKSDLLLGLALNEHQRGRVLRRIDADAGDLGSRLVEILGTNQGYRSTPPTWRAGQKFIELRGCQLERDKQRFKGKARDFIGYDELADFLESQYVFINTWNRSTDLEQRCRIVGATNGPTTAEGQWILRRWAAWLDPKHPNPAKDGELRWYLQLGDRDAEVDGPGPHETPRGLIRAKSRTFIRSKLIDNPDLARTDYGSQLEQLPEELRKVYRDGDFTVGLKDGDYQVIPTAWVEAAMQRWTPNIPPRLAMSAIAVDVAPEGGDKRVIGHRYGGWIGPLDSVKQIDKTGRKTAGAVVEVRRDNCPVVVDLGGGWGGDTLIALKENGIENVVAFNGVVAVTTKSRDGKLGFYNKRAESYWRVREELDPSQEGGAALAFPPDPELKGDLTAVHWKLTTRGILLEEKKIITERLGRSPDKGDTVAMLVSEGNRAIARGIRSQQQGGRPSHANVGFSHLKNRR